jgi:hypothetical protein
MTEIELDQTMELVLNFAWLLMCIVLIALWQHYGHKKPVHGATSRTIQLVALGVVLLILFPVISVSDDLMMAQSPAETVSCVHKCCNCGHHHHQMPTQAALPELTRTQTAVEYTSLVLMSKSLDRATQNPALRRVENRPPPSLS